ncbi:unnamed protein product [Pipistrellus nathusii]|uniref:Uncharacterized protein n=1 Tax=Pipistrellus nathusii TaxID=59473 RepID=A0ABN9Z8V9_PIPNA
METCQSWQGCALSRFPSVSPWKLTNLGGDIVPSQGFHPCHHGNLRVSAGSQAGDISYQSLGSPREDSHEEETRHPQGSGSDPSRTGGRCAGGRTTGRRE